jgi:NAD(P)H-dependent flavin oxidoreductase YrpB (nitropropane dioxygenase family)
LVEFFYVEPDAALSARVHEGGALAAWQVGSLDEAQRAVDAGCDFIVAQVTEAGGHVRGQVSLLPLLDTVLDAVAVPVVAAGGIRTPRSMAAVLRRCRRGAIGTRSPPPAGPTRLSPTSTRPSPVRGTSNAGHSA